MSSQITHSKSSLDVSNCSLFSLPQPYHVTTSRLDIRSSDKPPKLGRAIRKNTGTKQNGRITLIPTGLPALPVNYITYALINTQPQKSKTCTDLALLSYIRRTSTPTEFVLSSDRPLILGSLVRSQDSTLIF